jgi:hypothetical protein
MILRAAFWIAIVAVFMPHGPDLNLSQLNLSQTGSIASSLPGSITEAASVAMNAPHQACRDHADQCAATLGFIDQLQSLAVSSLAEARVEIEAAQANNRRQRLAYND